MGLFKNLRKVHMQKKKTFETVSDRVKKFPEIIDEQIQPVDVEKDKVVSEGVVGKKLELPKLNISKKENTPDILKVEKPNMESFFMDYYKKIKDGNILENELINQNLLNKMKGFWKNDERMIQNKSENEERKANLQKRTQEVLSNLANLENQWRSLRIEAEKINFALKNTEDDIEAESFRFKELVRKIKFHQDVMPENYFVMFDGKRVKNLYDLIGTLKIMSDFDFFKHVNKERNDFANWVRTTLNEPEVADKMLSIFDRQEMIRFLSDELSQEKTN